MTGTHTAELRLLPWRPRIRDLDGAQEIATIDGVDDLIVGAVGLVVWLLIALLGFVILPFVLFPLEVALVLIVVPGFYLLRMIGVLTWPVVVRDETGAVVRVERHRWLHRALARRDALRAGG
ncbi:MAG TPA: hypothetical protein VN408_16970 [Actinoplanes sp.]|nr:hypothetical protein [Actinoplanes sp.]